MSHLNYSKEQLLALTEQVGEAAVASGKHDLALSALLGAYATVALAHPCCLEECAAMTLRLHLILVGRIAANTTPSTVH